MFTLVRRCFTPVWVLAAAAMVGGGVASCGGGMAPDGPTPVALLDTTVSLPEGVTCNDSYVGEEFTAMAGKLVTISASGPATLSPLFILYAPDFATQLGVSSPAGPGAAYFAFQPSQTGLHHLSVCNVNGVAGTLKLVVNQR